MILGSFIFTIALGAAIFYIILRLKEMHLWFGSYVRQGLKPKKIAGKPVHILFCVVDHFEPMWERPTYEVEVKRVREWALGYAKLAEKHRDSDGVHPQHTFFYPEEEYRKEHLDLIAELCRKGYGEVEVHLHHDNDTADGLRGKIDRFKRILRGHGLLSHNGNEDPLYAFVHGNWALDNSRRDGRMCGVNNELLILKETGCYADFTLPSAPDQSQTKKINSIYYAADHPQRPKSHDDGIDVERGQKPSGDLMIIQGPLGLDWQNRKWGILPRIENGDLSFENPPTERRADLWISRGIAVKGREDWVFVKVHTHGTQENATPILLGNPMDRLFTYLETRYNDANHFALHYVTAREMYNIVKAAEDGKSGNPGAFRNYRLKKFN